MLFKSGNPSPKISGKTLVTCHCQEQMETPSLIPNWVLALSRARAAPQQPNTARQQPDPGVPSNCSAELATAELPSLPALNKPELGAEGARAAKPEGTRAESCASTALFLHEKE